MSNILIGLLGAMLTTNAVAAASNLVTTTTGITAGAAITNNAVEQEYQRLLAEDDAAQAEVDKWITDNQEFASKGGGVSGEQLRQRILDRLDPIRKSYDEFLKSNPRHVQARVAYGSFLGDIGDEEGCQTQWEKALELDPKDPAIYNNLANIYSHSGPVVKAFDYYAKAIELRPREPIYYHNLGTAVYLFRKDAKEHYKIDENQVFARAFELYSNAMRLDPQSFPLASDVAQTYYGISPMRAEEALKAWTNALSIAHDEIEREGVYIHMARVKMLAGRYDEAKRHLSAVTNEMYADLKRRVSRAINDRQSGNTNAPAAPAPTADKRD